MNTLMVGAGIGLCLAGALVLVRLVLGPSLHDRLVALDTLVVIVVCGLTVRAAHAGESGSLVIVVLVVLVGLLSTLTLVRLVPEAEQ